jgi:hypothetical protein
MAEPLIVRTITFDCTDARALAQFWAAVLGWNVYTDDEPEVLVAPSFPVTRHGGAPVLLFIPVPEPKTAKNRMHLDLGSLGSTRDDQVARLVGLGAREVGDYRDSRGGGWVVLTDPEGNEFCIERSDVERPAKARTYRIEAV